MSTISRPNDPLGKRVQALLWLPLQRVITQLREDDYTGWVMSVREAAEPYAIGLVVNQLLKSHVRTQDVIEQIRHYMEAVLEVCVSIEPLLPSEVSLGEEYEICWTWKGSRDRLHMWMVPNTRAQAWTGSRSWGLDIPL